MVDLNTIHAFHRFWCCIIICYFCLLYFVISDKEQSHLLPLLVTDFLGTFASSIVTTIHCPCYWRHCTVHIYVVIHFCDSVCSYRVEENLCRFFYRLLMYVLEIQLHVLRRKGCASINQSNPAIFYTCPKPGPGFPSPYVVVFLCVQWVQLRWEVIVHFIDIGGIDDHHCLKILFIINKSDLNTHDSISMIEYSCTLCWYWWNCLNLFFIIWKDVSLLFCHDL